MWCSSFSLVVIPLCFHHELAQHKVNTPPPDTTRLPHPFLGAPSPRHSNTWVRNSKEETTARAASSYQGTWCSRDKAVALQSTVLWYYYALLERKTNMNAWKQNRDFLSACRTPQLTGTFSRNLFMKAHINLLTLILLTWTIWRAPTNASKWRMGFNSAFKGLKDSMRTAL